MKGSEFFFNYVQLLFYKCHKINLNRGVSYIDSPDWTKNKKVTINLINQKDNKCFQYAVTATSNHKEIGKNPERIIKIKPLINKYKWEEINFPLEKGDWKYVIKNNVKTAINILYAKKEKYILLMFQNRKTQVILLMILNGEK